MIPPLDNLRDLTRVLRENRGVCFYTGHGLNPEPRFRAADTFLRGLDACPKLEERTMFPESLKQLPEAKRRVLQTFVGRASTVPLPEGAPDLTDLAVAMSGIARTALDRIILDYGWPSNLYNGLMRNDEWALSTAHYPFEAGKKGKLLFPAHKDWGTLAIYPFLEGAGLEASIDGEWRPVEVPKGAMLLYAGDILERLTEHTIPALVHRVVQPTDEPTGRTSMIFYVDTWRSMQLPNGKRVSEIIDEKLKKIGQIT